jgi:nitrate/nitrite transporter NarK
MFYIYSTKTLPHIFFLGTTRHDIAEILLQVALNTITLTLFLGIGEGSNSQSCSVRFRESDRESTGTVSVVVDYSTEILAVENRG